MSWWNRFRKPKPFTAEVLVSFDGWPSVITLSGGSEKHVLALKQFLDSQPRPTEPEIKGFGDVLKSCN